MMASMAMAQEAPAVVPDDPEVRTGVLPNGLTYFVKQNNFPARHVDFFIAQRVGSIQEEDSQRGLAHFLEHMCFNGTRHFPGNTIIDYMESIGVKFGANLNAYTSTDETVYNISNVPSDREGALDTCLLVLSDWSHDLLLRDKDIDEERGVIEGEWRHRSGANNRLLEKVAPVIYPGSRYGERMPIGTMDVVRNFKYKELRDYYKKWYHPGNQAIIVVGDIDPDATVRKIEKLFGKVKQPKRPAPVVAEPVPDNEQLIAVVAGDKELSQGTVRLMFKHDDLDPALLRTTAGLRHNYLKNVVSTMMRARFEELAQDSLAPFTRVIATDRDYMISKTRQAFQLVATVKPGMDTRAMTWMEREVNRALKHGFTEGELRRARLNYEAAVDKLGRERDKYSNTRYARDFVSAYIDGEGYPSIDTFTAMSREVTAGVTLEQVNEFFRQLISTTDRNVVIVGYYPQKEGAVAPEANALADAFRQARAMNTEPYIDVVKTDRLLDRMPTPGTITSRTEEPRFGAEKWTLSNGVNVYVKKTDLKPGEVVIAGAAPGGFSQNYSADQAPSFKALNQVTAISAYGPFTQTDLKKALAGKSVTMRTSVSRTEESFQGTSSRADLETALQLLYLKLTSPQKDEKAFRQFLADQRVRLENQTDPKFEFADSLFVHVFNHHPLAAEKLLADEIDRVDYNTVLNCYRDRWADVSDLNVYIVGDFDADTLATLVERYIGSLPAAGRIEKPRDIGYRLFDHNVVTEWSRKMENPQDKVYFFWTSECPYNLRTSLLAKITGQLFSRIFLEEIREKRGWTYHVQTHASVVADNNGDDAPVIYFPLNVTLTAGTAGETRTLVRQAITDVAANGVSTEQLDKVKKYLRKVYGEDIEDNTYWMAMMKNQAKYGLDFHNTYLETLDSITTADIRDFVSRYIAGGHRLELQMTPTE